MTKSISEQVRELESQLDAMTMECESLHRLSVTQNDVIAALESRQASARVKGAREALTLFALSLIEQMPVTKDIVRKWRDSLYPSPTEGDGNQGKPVCNQPCPSTCECVQHGCSRVAPRTLKLYINDKDVSHWFGE
jgi:hypothetical protein